MEQKTMKALVYRGPNDFGLMDVPVPSIKEPTDVIGKVTLSAICTSDVHEVHGHIPTVETPKIVGHEFCIEITEVGSAVKNYKVGDRCVVLPGTQCDECFMCGMGLTSFCDKGGVFGVGRPDGAQAEYIRVPWAEKVLVKIPDGLSEEDVIMAADMLTTGWFGLTNAEIKAGQTLAVIGMGPVGLSTCILAKKVFGAKQVIAIDIIQSRLDLASREGVADVIINPATDNVLGKVLQLTGFGVDATVETPGLEETMATASEITRPGGIISTVAIFSGPVKLPLQDMIPKNQKLKMGIVQASDATSKILELIKKGEIDSKFMLTHKAPLNDIVKGYEVFGKKQDGCVKWLVTPYKY